MTGRSKEFHGINGDWVMDEVRYQNPLSKMFLEVAASAGLGTNDDFNNWSRPQDGAGRFQVSETNGERCSGANAFLAKALKRKNLTVRTGTMARRVDFDEFKTAVGVTYDLMGDDTCTVRIYSILWRQFHFAQASSHLMKMPNFFFTVIPCEAQPWGGGIGNQRSNCVAPTSDVQWYWSCPPSARARYFCRLR